MNTWVTRPNIVYKCLWFFQWEENFPKWEFELGNFIINIGKFPQTSYQWNWEKFVDMGELVMPNGPAWGPGESIKGDPMKFEDLTDEQKEVLINSIVAKIPKPKDGESVKTEDVILWLINNPYFCEKVQGKPGKKGDSVKWDPGISVSVLEVAAEIKSDKNFSEMIKWKDADNEKIAKLICNDKEFVEAIKPEIYKPDISEIVEFIFKSSNILTLIVNKIRTDSQLQEKIKWKDGENIKGDPGKDLLLKNLSTAEMETLVEALSKSLLPQIPRGLPWKDFKYEDFTSEQLARLRWSIQNMVDQIVAKLGVELVVEYSPDWSSDRTKIHKDWDKFFRINIGSESTALPLN